MPIQPLLTTLDTTQGATRIREDDSRKRTQAEISADVTAVNYAYLPGLVERFGTNTAPGTTDMSEALAAANAQSITSGGVPISTNQILHIASETVITGKFVADRKQVFTPASLVVFGQGSVEAILPEWWGARADAAIDGSSGTDSTAGFEAAILASTEDGDGTVAIHPIDLGPGNYLVGNLEWPPASRVYGCGRLITNFVVAPGTTGKWFTDTGSAAKIVMEGFAMYGRGLTGLTHGLQLGYNGTQHGVEGYVRDIWVQNMPNAVLVDINGNVGFYDLIAAYEGATGLRFTGIANVGSKLVAYGCTTSGADLNLISVDGLEIEAPGDSSVPLYFTGNASVNGLVIALANGTTIPYLIELSVNATTWDIRQFCLAFGNTPAGITVSNGNIKRADATYCGGNATAGNRNGEGHYSSEHDAQTKQAFCLRIINTAGTLQHYIRDASNSTTAATALVKCINGASSTLTNTPIGADASTAFAAGIKIGSATDSLIIFDTPAQRIAASDFAVYITANSTGTALTALCSHQSINVNGVTRSRFTIQLLNSTTGGGFGINTTNITSGNLVQLVFSGYLSA